MKELVALIEDKKGMNIVTIDVEEVTSIAKYIIIVTATSMVHSKSLTNYILKFFKENNEKLYNKNLETNNPWILIDAANTIVHIFQSDERKFYDLEKLYFKGKVVYRSWEVNSE